MAVCWQKDWWACRKKPCRLQIRICRGLSCSQPRRAGPQNLICSGPVWKVAKLQPEVLKAQNQYELALAAFQNILARSVRKDIPEGDFALPETLTLSWRKLWSMGRSKRMCAEAFGYWHEIMQIRYNLKQGNYLPNVLVQGDFRFFTGWRMSMRSKARILARNNTVGNGRADSNFYRICKFFQKEPMPSMPISRANCSGGTD